MKKITCKKICITLAMAMMLGGVAGCSIPGIGNKDSDGTQTANSDNKDSKSDSNTGTSDGFYGSDNTDSNNNTDNPATIVDDDGKIKVGISLSEVATFADFEGLSMESGKLCKKDGAFYKLLTWDGKETDGTYVVLENLGKGLTVVRKAVAGINNVGVVDLDGNFVIPCEADVIEWVDYQTSIKNKGRYLRVCYATTEVKNKDDCFIYITDNMFSIQAQAGDTMYNGYAKFFDTKNNSFAGDLRTKDDPKGYGDYIGIYSNTTRKDTLYDESGSVYLDTEDFSGAGDSCYIIYNSEDYKDYLYDYSGTKHATFDAKATISPIPSTGGYLRKKIDDTIEVIDIDGNVIFDCTANNINYVRQECEGTLLVEKNDETNALITVDGKVIAEGYEHIYASSNRGYYNGEKGGVKYVIGPNGEIAEGVSDDDNLCDSKENGDGTYSTFIFGNNDFTLKTDSRPSSLGIGVISINDEAGDKTIYETFTGKQLVDEKFDRLYSNDYFVYGLKDGTWHVYKKNYTYK